MLMLCVQSLWSALWAMDTLEELIIVRCPEPSRVVFQVNRVENQLDPQGLAETSPGLAGVSLGDPHPAPPRTLKTSR